MKDYLLVGGLLVMMVLVYTLTNKLMPNDEVRAVDGILDLRDYRWNRGPVRQRFG